eukprot:TRINITY_DN15537_c0_g1_i1.p1 TRINITY_DN15537_c0_g1~~TRINITY_DN15537_c0_g1_i1.p1  ORF type:complete len:264 (-),score=43.02 TRINITY_DN15537_c0_g1_i1:208-999(-)
MALSIHFTLPALSHRHSPTNSIKFTIPATNSLRSPTSRCLFIHSRRSLTAKASIAVDSPVASGSDRCGDSPNLLLEVKDLTAVIAESKQQILRGVNIAIYEGEVHAVMGKNGSGKSTFAKVLVGHPDYEVTGGSIVFRGANLLDMDPEERSHAGLFMSFQSPVEIPGVSNMDFMRMAYNARRKKRGLSELGPIEFYGFLSPKLAAVNMNPNLLNRNVNEGFSGGEKKRNEILQLAEDGRIVKTGDSSLAKQLEKEGYKAISSA